MSKFQTTAAYISGGITGQMWNGPIGGFLFQADIRRELARMSGRSGFRDVLLSLLSENGGDFIGAEFTADTVIRIERRTPCGNGSYHVHVCEREIAQLHDCEDLANTDVYVTDFMGEDV